MKKFIWAWSFQGQGVSLNQENSLLAILEILLDDYEEHDLISKVSIKEKNDEFKISFKNVDDEKQSFTIKKDITAILEWFHEYHCDEDNSLDYFLDIVENKQAVIA